MEKSKAVEKASSCETKAPEEIALIFCLYSYFACLMLKLYNQKLF